MYSPIVLSVYKPPLSPYVSSTFPVLAVPVIGHYTYITAMQQLWAKARILINIEHDIQANDEQIQELVDCKRQACTFAYKIWKPHLVDADANVVGSHTQESYWCQYDWHEDGSGRHFQSIEEGTEESIHSGLGFCKVTTAVMRTPLERAPWHQVESEVNRSVHLWHIHWPAVQHWHR